MCGCIVKSPDLCWYFCLYIYFVQQIGLKTAWSLLLPLCIFRFSFAPLIRDVFLLRKYVANKIMNEFSAPCFSDVSAIIERENLQKSVALALRCMLHRRTGRYLHIFRTAGKFPTQNLATCFILEFLSRDYCAKII